MLPFSVIAADLQTNNWSPVYIKFTDSLNNIICSTQ